MPEEAYLPILRETRKGPDGSLRQAQLVDIALRVRQEGGAALRGREREMKPIPLPWKALAALALAEKP